MTDITETIDDSQKCLTVAASAAITDYSDVLARGYLKEHPAMVAYRLDLLTSMIEAVQAAVTRELGKAGEWGPLEDPGTEHHAMVAEFAEHACNCEWCYGYQCAP